MKLNNKKGGFVGEVRRTNLVRHNLFTKPLGKLGKGKLPSYMGKYGKS